MTPPSTIARVLMPTAHGEFVAHAFDVGGGLVYVALVMGELGEGRSVLARVHSECLTGDALGSRRCDCGVQLTTALRRIAAEGRGVLVYATGHEGRGIGLAHKLRAYAEQDGGMDTVDANVHLGLPVDARTYGDAAEVLLALGVRSIRLLTNNPAKVEGLRAAGIEVEDVEGLATAPHARNIEYLRAKRRRLGHAWPGGPPPLQDEAPPPDTTAILGPIRPRPERPYVALKYAQTLDGRIATADGDARWISGEAERRVSHSLRAACDAVLVGVGTVLRDDCSLTVRLVPGASPVRVVLDSTLRTPPDAAVLDQGAPTVIVTTPASPANRRADLRRAGVGVEVVPAGADGVSISAALLALRRRGIRSLLVEGGAEVITSLLAAGLADRIVVGIAPTILGAGTDAVGDLGVTAVSQGLHLANRSVHLVGDDLLVAWDVAPAEAGAVRSEGAIS